MAAITEPKVSALDLSEGAQEVLHQIMQLSGKPAGDTVAEALSLALLYEQTRKQNGRLMVETGGKLQEIVVP